MGYAVLVGCIDEGIDTVVDIFLDRVVDRALAVGRAGAVVVHSQSAATVDEVHVVPHLVEVDVELSRLTQRGLYTSYLGNLAANVEVDKTKAVVQALLIKDAQGVEELRTGKSELRRIASALGPFARTARCELDAYAQVRLHVELLGCAGDDVKLVELLDNDKDALSHLLGQQSQLDVALVLVSIADDERVALALHGYHGVELWLGTRLKSQIELAAVRDDFLDHRLHLIDLDGIDNKVLCLVLILLSRPLEAVGGLLDTVVEDIGESEQQRGRHVAQRQLIYNLAQVYLGFILTGRDADVAFLVDVKVRSSPAFDVIHLARVFDAPFLHIPSSFFSCWVVKCIFLKSSMTLTSMVYWALV